MKKHTRKQKVKKPDDPEMRLFGIIVFLMIALPSIYVITLTVFSYVNPFILIGIIGCIVVAVCLPRLVYQIQRGTKKHEPKAGEWALGIVIGFALIAAGTLIAVNGCVEAYFYENHAVYHIAGAGIAFVTSIRYIFSFRVLFSGYLDTIMKRPELNRYRKNNRDYIFFRRLNQDFPLGIVYCVNFVYLILLLMYLVYHFTVGLINNTVIKTIDFLLVLACCILLTVLCTWSLKKTNEFRHLTGNEVAMDLIWEVLTYGSLIRMVWAILEYSAL